MEGEVEKARQWLYTPRIERVRICISARFDFESSVPMRHPRNIINRGDIEVEAIQNLMEKIVSSSKEDGASADAGAEAVDEDAVDMEENDVTIGGMDGKMLRNVFNHFPLHDIRSTLACVNSKWRETALDATPSPDDYLTTLEEDRIPCAIEFLGQQKEQVETYGGVEYIKVFAGEGVILKDHEDIWRMLSNSYTPPKWVSISNRPKQFHKRRKGGLAVVQI
mmetsp:Transcript_2548/g.3816  ORF Transcript_2548/g.3816 Transcript_2548/m.3816 type:complete len:222 (+) Transcript_2548:274-939(+)